jgi:hypothetical protein
MTFEEWANNNPHDYAYHSLVPFDSFTRGNRYSADYIGDNILDCLSDSISFHQDSYSYDSADRPSNVLHRRIVRYLSGEVRFEQSRVNRLEKCLLSGKRVCS